MLAGSARGGQRGTRARPRQTVPPSGSLTRGRLRRHPGSPTPDRAIGGGTPLGQDRLHGSRDRPAADPAEAPNYGSCGPGRADGPTCSARPDRRRPAAPPPPGPRNPLRTTHPNLADEAVWDYATNKPNGITPDKVSFGRHGKVSWLCPHGSFEAEIRVRVQGHGCTRCAGEVSGRRRARRPTGTRRRAEAKRIRESRVSEPGTILPFGRRG
jgi:hypothetical protein